MSKLSRRSRIITFPLAFALVVGLGAGSTALLCSPRVARADSLETLQQRIEESNTAYTQAQQRVDDLQQQMEANEQRIQEIEGELPQKRAAAADSIRTLYKMQQTSGSLIDLLLSSDDFNEVITNVRYLDTITSHNNSAINELVELDNELSQARSALASEKAQADSDAQSAKDALDSAVSARQQLEQEMAAQAAAEEAQRQAAIAAAQKAAEEAAAKAAEEAAANADADADAGSGTSFTTNTGGTAQVQVPSSPDAGNVDWSSDKSSFVSSWGARIDAYLAGSPLAGQGKTFAEAAWTYGVDPRFSPAISLVESSKGAACFLPHNAWGWGSSSWSTWEEAIWDHVEGLAIGYGGHLTYAGAQKYCPPSADFWYATVLSEMEKI